ncbi:MAG: cadherin-like domain-containing protein [Ilumatobacteraceae bacterium]
MGAEDRADVLLAEALAQAVREVGPGLTTDARRVQGMVSDILGAESRMRRAEIDAVVVATEESVPADLLAGRITPQDGMRRLGERGLDGPVAHFAVDVWLYALGMLETDAEPPSLTNSLEVVTDSVTSDQDDGHDAGPVVDVVDSGEVDRGPDGPGGGGRPSPPLVVPVTPAGPARPDERRPNRVLVLAGAAVLVVVAVVGVILLLDRGDEEVTGAPSTSASGTTDGPASTSVATTLEATTTVAPAPLATFDPEAVSVGELRRTWALEGGQLVATLTFTNTTGAETTGRYVEVVPKSVAATADQVVSDSAPIVFNAEPVLAWDLTVPAGGAVSVSYRVDVADEATAAELELWKADQIAEAAANKIVRETPPAVSIGVANDTVAGASEIDVSGTADPAATVTVNGVPVTVNTDGTWALHVADLAPGPNPVTVTATNVYGTANTLSANVVYDPPAPPNEAPVKLQDITYAVPAQCAGSVSHWTVPVMSAFSDPDGDPLVVVGAVTPTGHAELRPDAIHWSEPVADFVGDALVDVTVSDGQGATASAVLTISVPPGKPGC